MRQISFTRFHYGWLVLFMGTLTIFGALGLARFGYTMVLPNMQAGLGMDNGQAGTLATISLVGYLALAIVGGALSTKYGVRLVATVGLVLAGAGMFFMGLSHTFISVAFWSGLSGIGSGAVNIAIMGLWPAWFSKKRRGLASGIAVTGSSMGLISTGSLIPLIITAYGATAWNVSWFLFGSTTLLIALGAHFIIRNNPAELGLKPIGEEEGLTTNLPKEKATWRNVYYSTPVWYLGLVYIAFGFTYIIYMTFFVKYLVTEFGLTGRAAGNLFMLMGFFSLFSGILWGLVSDKIGRKRTLVILYLIQGLGLGLFALGGSQIFFVLSAILYGITAWSIPAIMSATCGDMLGPQLAPAALGFITLFFGIGQVLGPVVAGAMADALGSFSPVFMLASVIALLGAGSAGLLINNAAHQYTMGNSMGK